MRNTRRIKRMSRNRMKLTKMNLTSLMDVFTILVFFLLVNSGSVEVLDAPKDVELPESKVEAKPRETVVIFVSPEEVLVQGRQAALVDEIQRRGTGNAGGSGQSRGDDPRRQVGPFHRDQADHVDVHGRRLRECVAGRCPEGTATGSGAVIAQGRGWQSELRPFI
jgi:hypothetical protein